MRVQGDPLVGKALQAGVGPQKIGGHGYDQRVGIDDGLHDGGKIVIDDALVFKQAHVATPTGPDVVFLQTQQSEPVGLIDAAADLFGHDVAVVGALLGIFSFGFFLLGSILSIISLFLILSSKEEFENGKKGKSF